MIEDDIEKLKDRLKKYKREEITFNEPHFTSQMALREGNREEVINNLLNPDNLIFSFQEEGKFGDVKHNLHFYVSNSRTMILPVIFDARNKKGLYVITYIMRHRGIGRRG